MSRVGTGIALHPTVACEPAGQTEMDHAGLELNSRYCYQPDIFSIKLELLLLLL